MRQGAHVYSLRAREELNAGRVVASQEADRLVAMRSTPTHLDLHGVSVDDGVRIATRQVQIWWDRIQARRRKTDAGGKDKAPDAADAVYTVVTGIGRHSPGGVSQLRSRVRAALKEAGWNLNVDAGCLVVKGRSRF